MIHIAFLQHISLTQILDGHKTCESRLSVNRHPARNTAPGDILLLKCRDVRASAVVSRIEIYESLGPLDIDALRDLYTAHVDGPLCDHDYWRAKEKSRFAVFLWLTDIQRAYIPHSLLPSNQTGWVYDYQPGPLVQRYLAPQDPHRVSEPVSDAHPPVIVPQVIPLPAL